MKRVFSYIQSKVARRIFVQFILCALLPVCLLALLSLQRVSARLEEDSHERLRQAAKSTGMTIIGGLNLLQAELESISIPSGNGVRGNSGQADRSSRSKQFRAVTILKSDAAGGAIPGMSRQLSPAAHAHLAAGNALLLADSDLGAGNPLHLATAANPNLPRQCLLVGEINRESLWSLVESSQSAGIDFCILGPSGKTLFASRPLTPALVSLVMSKQKVVSSGKLKWRTKDEDYLVNYWPIFLKPAFLADSWTVVTAQSRHDSLGPARYFLFTFLLVVLLTLFAVVFISSVQIRRSLVPLSILQNGARRLSGGDFDARVEISSGDEFEDLAVSFNDMSRQLGRQFARQSEMGKLVQNILEAHDRDTIIDAVMSRFRNAVPCEWLGLALVDGDTARNLLTTYNNSLEGAPTGILRFDSCLNSEEIEMLQETVDTLRICAGQGFSTLLAPMIDEGAGDFFLLPIFIKDRLLGVLILGYHCAPEQIREELLLSRQVTDEIAISLDNVRLIDELNCLNRGTIEALANAVDAKSPWTSGHSHRVTGLALEIGREMGLSGSDIKLLQLGGMFHDMGKIGISEEILDKPGLLTDDEYALIKDHPENGAAILEPIRAYQEVIPIVAQHHEQFDGKGYPLGLAGEDIALGARILAVADVFDALYSDRPYRQGWDLESVVSFLQENAGSQFDPVVVRAFMEIDWPAYFDTPARPGWRTPDLADERWKEN